MNLLVSQPTSNSLKGFKSKPSHALIIVGPTGSGKLALAQQLAADLLEINFEDLQKQAYLKHISPADAKSISIETIRELEHFLSLKVPGKKSVNRLIIIEDSHLMGAEAQNALLKILEEPPEGTVLILTAGDAQSLLPTIRSRSQVIDVIPPELSLATDHFTKDGYSAPEIKQAISISGGLPGLMTALLSDTEHPLRLATEKARQLLSQNSYERLVNIDELAKNPALANDTLFILQQMARMSLQTAEGPAANRWQRVLKASYRAQEALSESAQAKLVLIELMLAL